MQITRIKDNHLIKRQVIWRHGTLKRKVKELPSRIMELNNYLEKKHDQLFDKLG